MTLSADAADPVVSKLYSFVVDHMLEREKLLLTLVPTHPQIQQLEAQIVTAQQALRAALQSRLQALRGKADETQKRIARPKQERTSSPDIALVAGLYLTSDSLRQQSIPACLADPITLPLVFTLSRSSYVALVPMAAGLFAWSDRKRFLATFFAISLALLPVLTPKAVIDRIFFTISQPADSAQIRVGDAQYPRVLAETGLIGLSTFIWLQAAILRRTLSVLRQSQDWLFRGVALGVAAGFLGLITHSLGSNTFIIVRSMEPFWFLVGMVIMIPELEHLPAVAIRKESYEHWVGHTTPH